MIDVEKVIKALEFCTDSTPVDSCFGKCPYAVADDDYKCLEMKLDALELLYSKREIRVTECIYVGKNQAPVCPVCGETLGVTLFGIKTGARKPNYCMHCGQAVKWSE